jgi:hypothetical protein
LFTCVIVLRGDLFTCGLVLRGALVHVCVIVLQHANLFCRKSMSNLAVNEPFSFRALVLKVKDKLLETTGYDNGMRPKNTVGPYNAIVGETRHLVDKI